MKVDHQQNHQKYLKEDSQLENYFCHYQRINKKSQPNLNLYLKFLEFLNITELKAKYLNNKYKQAK